MEYLFFTNYVNSLTMVVPADASWPPGKFHESQRSEDNSLVESVQPGFDVATSMLCCAPSLAGVTDQMGSRRPFLPNANSPYSLDAFMRQCYSDLRSTRGIAAVPSEQFTRRRCPMTLRITTGKPNMAEGASVRGYPLGPALGLAASQPKDALLAQLVNLLMENMRDSSITAAMPAEMDLDQLFGDFLIAKRAAGLRERTVSWYAEQMGVFFRWCAENKIEQATQEGIERFLAEQRQLKPKLSDATISARFRTLSVFFSWVAERYDLEPAANPMYRVKAPKVRKKPIVHVQLHEFLTLYEAVDGDEWPAERDRLILLILFWSGLRLGEVCALEAHDIDIQSRLICVKSAKGDSARYVPCSPDVGHVLLRYLYARPAWPHAHLLVSNDGNGGIRGRLTHDGLRQMIERRCKDCGLRNMNPHAFRHGFAMEFLNAGMQLSAVSEAMGHSSQTITRDIYARWLTQGLSREYERVRRTLEKSSRSA